MNEWVLQSDYFALGLSLVTYSIGMAIRKRFPCALCNPLLLSIVMSMAALAVLRIDYANYAVGAKHLSVLLTPATVCLAVGLYEQIELLRRHWRVLLGGILAGTLTSALCIFVLCRMLELGHSLYITLLPKSVTTAIGMGISEELGGYTAITVASIVVTGIFGNMFAPQLCRFFRLRHPAARGIAIGTAAHAVGTAKACEMGEVEGAMSSLALVIAGLLTVVLAPMAAGWL